MPKPMIDTDDIEVLRTQFKAWMQGVHAAGREERPWANPYEPRSAAGDAWENGNETASRIISSVMIRLR